MTTLTAKQVKKLIEVFEDTSTEQVQALYASGLLTDLRDGHIRQVNREEFRQVLGLAPLDPSADPLADFFKTRSGLWVSSDFASWILTPALTMDPVASATIWTLFNITKKDMTDTEIRRKLGKYHVFENARAFCLYLKGALKSLRTRVHDANFIASHTNLFYVRGFRGKVFRVTVHWDGSRGWVVGAFPIGFSRMRVGDRVFVCNP